MKPQRVALIVLLMAIIGVGAVGTPASAAATLAAPTGLRVLSTSTKAISVGWTAVKGAARYRVQYAATSAFSGAKSVSATGPAADVSGLAPGRSYHLRVTALNTAGDPLSKTSASLRAATRASGYTYLAPLNLKVTAKSTTTLSLSWGSRGAGISYRVSYATDASFSKAVFDRETATNLTLTKLQPNTKYHLKVRVIRSDGTNLSAYSPAITVVTNPMTAPGKLKVTATSKTALALQWNEVSGAERYRVQYSTSAAMSKAKYARFFGTGGDLTGLRSGTSYYLRIRVITPSGTNLSAYSAAIKTGTATTATSTYLPPAGISATAISSSRISVRWTSRGSGLRYQMQYATNSGLDKAAALTLAGPNGTVSGLSEATTYYLRIRVVSSSGGALSSFSQPVSATTRSEQQPRLIVASYNVKCANCFGGLPNEGTWYERRDSVVAAVKAQHADVIGFQEASQGWLKDSAGNVVNKSQFEDLVERLGSPYRLTNTHRNNCVKSTTPTNCVYHDRGASQGTKIVYNSSTLSLVAQGSRRLSKVKGSDQDRYVAWAILEHKNTGRRFLFADTHLEHLGDSSGSSGYYNLRIAQTREALAVIKAKRQGLPVYFVGDFNSHKWTVPTNGPYDELRAGGFIDPLGNTYRSTTTSPGAIVGNRIRTNFSSFNGFASAPRSFGYVNGTYLDYIWVSAGIEVPEWETVVSIGSNGNFVGTIPSDHNMIRATTVLE